MEDLSWAMAGSFPSRRRFAVFGHTRKYKLVALDAARKVELSRFNYTECKWQYENIEASSADIEEAPRALVRPEK